MNLDTLLAALTPDGAPDSPAPPPALSAPEPLDATTLPPDAGPLMAGGASMPHPAAAQGGGIADHLQEMLPMLIAGLMSGAALKNPGPYGRGEDIAALGQGLLHGYHTANQGKLAAHAQDNADRKLALEEARQNQDELDRAAGRAQKGSEVQQKHNELSSNFILNAVKGADQFKDDPTAWASYAKMMDGVGAKVFGMSPGTLSAQLQFPDGARGKKAQKDAEARIKDLTALYGPEKMFAPEVLDATTTFDGKPVKVRDLMALAEMAIIKPGASAEAPAAGGDVVTPAPKGGDDFDKYLKTTYMPDKGIAGRAPTRAEVLDARKEWQQAGSTQDPEMRDLTKELAKQRLADAKNKSAGVGEITAGTPEYRMAENIAFGKTTLAQAKGLYSGRESKGKETLRAVLDKAEQINPDFNAALFEQGYKFASNPKTQMAMVAVNRVEPNIDKLIELSDKWDRTKYPSVNAFLKAVKFQWGNQTISDFTQLQTIVGDELGSALGVGAASDMKTKLGLEMAGGTKGPEAMRSGLLLVKEALHNQKRALLGPMGPYGAPAATPDQPRGGAAASALSVLEARRKKAGG